MFLIKRIVDIIFSCFIVLFLSPIFLIICLLIKLTSVGPVFFIQKRLGKDLKVFNMYKFRTMVQNAESVGTGLFSYENDPRITKVGTILRKSSLDELPQLFNVIIGDMSLVGPRPPVTYELGPIEDFDENLRARFKFKPGITGLAQVSGRNDLDWLDKIELDNQYIDSFINKGVIVDLVILIKTIFVVFSMNNTVEKEK